MYVAGKVIWMLLTWMDMNSLLVTQIFLPLFYMIPFWTWIYTIIAYKWTRSRAYTRTVRTNLISPAIFSNVTSLRHPALTVVEEDDYVIPSDDKLEGLDDGATMKIYWKYVNNLQVLCKNIIRVGNLKDGGKEICVDTKYKPQEPCIVYSFGINYMFDFDKAISETFGCHVYCFDPSMKNNSYQVTDKIWFYRWGIAGRNMVNEMGWHLKTLGTIRKELGHTNRTIDILKIDVEGDEWNSIPEMISSGSLNDVKQISMETHFGPVSISNPKYWGGRSQIEALKVLRQLYEQGFRIFMRERNFWSYWFWPGINQFLTNVNEVSLIKI